MDTGSNNRKLLVVQVAALGYQLLADRHRNEWHGLTFREADSIFPALTCPVQACFRTASLPAAHGMVANGLWDRTYARVRFWEQAADLVQGRRIWESRSGQEGQVAMLFWQQSLGERADILLSPAPIHKHHGGIIQAAYSQPANLYTDLCETMGHPFKLAHYWGPFASTESSAWIAEATAQVMQKQSPALCFTYLPALDYDLQRFGSGHARSIRALDDLFQQLELLYETSQKEGYDLLVYGDYAIEDCPQGAVFPNRVLYENGLLSTRTVRGRLYPDFYTTPAFCLADHEIAHVTIRRPADTERAARLLANQEGIERVLAGDELKKAGIDHPNSGTLVLVAAPGYWLAYPWWSQPAEAPDYAGHVDIHNKPGYDPCELLLGWPPGSVTQNTGRIHGSHGRVGPGRSIAWVSTCLDAPAGSLLDLAAQTRDWIAS